MSKRVQEKVINLNIGYEFFEFISNNLDLDIDSNFG
jgi:hypothetical protein